MVCADQTAKGRTMILEHVSECRGVFPCAKTPSQRYVVAIVRHNGSERTVVRFTPPVVFVGDVITDLQREAPGAQVERLGVGMATWEPKKNFMSKPVLLLAPDGTGLPREQDPKLTADILRRHFRGHKVTVN